MLNALRRMGYQKHEMSVHGFRSIASTLLNELGYNRDWIERQLAHGDKNEVRAAYNYAEYLPERHKMMQEWTNPPLSGGATGKQASRKLIAPRKSNLFHLPSCLHDRNGKEQ